MPPMVSYNSDFRLNNNFYFRVNSSRTSINGKHWTMVWETQSRLLLAILSSWDTIQETLMKFAPQRTLQHFWKVITMQKKSMGFFVKNKMMDCMSALPQTSCVTVIKVTSPFRDPERWSLLLHNLFVRITSEYAVGKIAVFPYSLACSSAYQ